MWHGGNTTRQWRQPVRRHERESPPSCVGAGQGQSLRIEDRERRAPRTSSPGPWIGRSARRLLTLHAGPQLAAMWHNRENNGLDMRVECIPPLELKCLRLVELSASDDMPFFFPP
eukprot:CAMPEP_0185208118 /NCGR_PEP_ID=MMETSP1140-20130426/61505_1 /TAXON_ID=298111 /ORGANISM="Pavlova sp., Strain CCMP459" /LENGTH=114 /DNA_ID=CAMNT_0027775833 /DNA_START=77 /DNA_END=419 /DNA_ORIENTATION=+